MRQWYDCLSEVKKKDEEKRMDVKLQKLVSRMIRSAEGGGTDLLHDTSKSTSWRGELQILQDQVKDVNPLARCEKKRKEWARHKQHDAKVQDLEDKPWRSEELKSLEEGMPRLM